MLAKTLFRTTSARVVSGKQSVRNVAKVIVNSQRSVMGMSVTGTRMFSNVAGIEKAVQKLSKALEKEIKYENENYSQLEDIETFLNESGFKFSEQENGTQMVLTKTVGDKTVEVHFEAR